MDTVIAMKKQYGYERILPPVNIFMSAALSMM